jgi:hypothetical protein
VSALPLARNTMTSARVAPTQNGNNRIATMVLAHFGIETCRN